MSKNKSASKNNTASIGFEQQIWAAADILRGVDYHFLRA